MVGGRLEDQGGRGKTHWKKTWTYWALTGVTRQRSCQMETTRRPMFCWEREELSLSLDVFQQDSTLAQGCRSWGGGQTVLNLAQLIIRKIITALRFSADISHTGPYKNHGENCGPRESILPSRNPPHLLLFMISLPSGLRVQPQLLYHLALSQSHTPASY